MLIRSSFVSLVLAAAFTSAANCDSPATPNPLPEAPKQVDLQLLSEESVCATNYKVAIESSGAFRVVFEDLVSEPVQGKYRAYCRLAGTITIPKGFALDPSLAFTAIVKGELKGGIDNVTGRLRISLGRYASRDFELTEYAQSDAPSPSQTVTMDLKTQLPETPSSCTEDLTWPVSLFVESTINGKASSRIEELKLDRLILVPLACNS